MIFIIVMLVIPAILFIPALVAIRLSSIGDDLFDERENDTGMLVVGAMLWIILSLIAAGMWPITIAALIATAIIKKVRKTSGR